ncbi:FAD/NAD(P)-binding domain-containing protein [Panus rudis PR-1116 ss-1]|nr:FAD/NAD(P)-binding domain-containing protein [Panus rudis PR-1116 ss-1]
MNASERTKDFRVAVVGGGVCGLACAIALARDGVPVEIFESASKFGEIGAGLGLGPNSIRVLRDLQVLDDVIAKSIGGGPNMVCYRWISGTHDQEVLYNYPLSPEDYGMGIARSAFLDALVNHFDMSKVHFKKRCVSVEPSSQDPARYIVSFADGTTHEADVVIGADGIRSTVRGAVTGRPSDDNLAFSNTVGYRTLSPFEDVNRIGLKGELAPGLNCFVGKNKHIIAYLIQGNSTVNIIGFVTNMNGEVPAGNGKLSSEEKWVQLGIPKEELLNRFEGWSHDATTLLSCGRNINKWSIHVVHPHLETYVRGGIALIGDAAHAMRTHLGAGAGQGLEDGFILARLLSHPSARRSNIQSILQVYDEIRRPRSQYIADKTSATGDIYDGRGPSGMSAEGIQKDLENRFDDVWHHDLHADLNRAIEELQTRGVFQ